MVTDFGAIPTPVEVSGLPTALITDVVVGLENPLIMIASNDLHGVQSHVSRTGNLHVVLAVVINEAVWQSPSEEDHAAITRGLDRKPSDPLQGAMEAESQLIADPKGHVMTFIAKAEGLDPATVPDSVAAEIGRDVPDVAPLFEQVEALQ